MSTDLPALNGKEVVSALKKAGFQVARIKGSHHILKKTSPTYTVVVPIHAGRSLPKGTLLRIITSAGLTKETFLSLL